MKRRAHAQEARAGSAAMDGPYASRHRRDLPSSAAGPQSRACGQPLLRGALLMGAVS